MSSRRQSFFYHCFRLAQQKVCGLIALSASTPEQILYFMQVWTTVRARFSDDLSISTAAGSIRRLPVWS